MTGIQRSSNSRHASPISPSEKRATLEETSRKEKAIGVNDRDEELAMFYPVG
jgi:hypothetical protein